METSIVTSKGQVLIPARLRRKHGIKSGEKVIFVEVNGQLIVQPLTREYFRQFAGMFGEHSIAGELLLSERKADNKKENAFGK